MMEARAEVATEQSECLPEQPSLQPLEELEMVRVQPRDGYVSVSKQPCHQTLSNMDSKAPDRFQF